MLLAIDVCNTNVMLGVFDDGKLVERWRLTTDPVRTADEYGTLVLQLFEYDNIDRTKIDDIIIATVVPSVLFALQHMSIKYFEINPFIVETGIKTGLSVQCDDPRQIGSDRIVNSVAAHTKYEGTLIVIDFGTATTISVVTDEGEFIGGTIAPGLKISAKALFEETAKLPHVELETPSKTIGKNTIESMQSGLVYGHMGMTERIVAGIKKELVSVYGKKLEDIKVIATGGMASMMEEGVECIDYIDKMLTIEGLAIIYKKNIKSRVNKRVQGE